MAGILWVVATPIGNLADFSIRAQDILKSVDAILCEDSRQTFKLCQHYHINKPLIALHKHNENQLNQSIIQRLMNGENLALVSDAGTPVISDPGGGLIYLAHQNQIKVSPVVGASSVIAGLSVSGFLADKFSFFGFIPVKLGEKQVFFNQINKINHTIVCFEAPHRIKNTLEIMQNILDCERELVIGRELTKQFEEVAFLQVKDCLSWLMANPYREKGEFVLIIKGANHQIDNNWQKMVQDLAKTNISAKDCAEFIHKHQQIPKKTVYEYFLATKKG